MYCYIGFSITKSMFLGIGKTNLIGFRRVYFLVHVYRQSQLRTICTFTFIKKIETDNDYSYQRGCPQ